MTAGRTRPIAICVLRDGERMLCPEGYDSVKREKFYRPLGGSIEFNERGHETVRREVREEIGAEIADIRYLGMLENLFTCEGKPGHEIVLVYEARFADASLYDQDSIVAHEDVLGVAPWRCVWKTSADLRAEGVPMYPDGLLDLLDGR